jgi:SAM-dependent methyltransferase
MRDILNLGCGRQLMDGAVNLDVSPDVGADVVHDLARLPWPLPSDAFVSVYAYDVIEHLENVVDAMEEIHRICKPGARVHITVPHYSSANAYRDPTHRHQFGRFSFDYFVAGHELEFYSAARFKRHRAQIIFYPTVVNKIVHRLANRNPLAY